MSTMVYYLKIMSGNRAGEQIQLDNGEYFIGRAEDCQVCINIAGLSRKHAKITVSGRNVMVEDLGSSNGTFVNGIFVTRKNLSVGDKIVLPGVMFTLTMGIAQNAQALRATGTDSFSGISVSELNPSMNKPLNISAQRRPMSLKEAFQEFFTKNFQPMIDGVLRAHDWKTVMVWLLSIYCVAITSLVSVRFIMLNYDTVREEVKRRGEILAKRMAELNTIPLQADNRSALDVEKTLKEVGVAEAYLATTDGKIIAPLDRYGEQVPSAEWLSAARAENGAVVPIIVDNSISQMVFSHPIPKFDPSSKQNVVGAVALVLLDLDGRTVHWSESMNVVLTTLITSALLVALAYLFAYRMTAQPFMDMNDEIEQVLKGQRHELRMPIKFMELETLVRSFNFLLNKIKSERAKIASTHQDKQQISQRVDVGSDPSFKFVVEHVASPVIILDTNQKIGDLSTSCESILGIASGRKGLAIVDACEDQNILGQILQAEREARALNGIPYSASFDALGKSFTLQAIAGFDDMGEHQRTVFLFNVTGS